MFRTVFDYLCRYYKTTLGLSSVLISWYQTSSATFGSVRNKLSSDIVGLFIPQPCTVGSLPQWTGGPFTFESMAYQPSLTAEEVKACIERSTTIGDIFWNGLGGVKSITVSQLKQYLLTSAKWWNVLLSFVIVDNFRLICQRVIFLFQFNAVDVTSITLITEIVQSSISVVGLSFSILKQISLVSLLFQWLGFGGFLNLTNPFVVCSTYIPLICSIGESSLGHIFQWFGLRQNTVIKEIGKEIRVIPVPDYFPPAISPFGEESFSMIVLSPIGERLQSVLGKPIFDSIAYCACQTSIAFKRAGELLLLIGTGLDGG